MRRGERACCLSPTKPRTFNPASYTEFVMYDRTIYTRLRGKWTYIYRAIDQDGQVVDAYFSKRRNAKAAEAFFRRAIDETGSTPTRVTSDKAACYPPALRVVLPTVEHRTSKYLNNGMERDHQHLKQRLYPNLSSG